MSDKKTYIYKRNSNGTLLKYPANRKARRAHEAAKGQHVPPFLKPITKEAKE